jgi:hypothetical protein
MEAAEEAALVAAPERCTMLPVQNAARHARSPSNLMGRDQCTVAIATRSTDRLGRPEDTS